MIAYAGPHPDLFTDGGSVVTPATPDTQTPPGLWERLPDEQLMPEQCRGWRHRRTKLRVVVERDRRPLTMADPTDVRTDDGYCTFAYGPKRGRAPLTFRLSGREDAVAVAREFMRCYPDGEFDARTAEHPPDGSVEWRPQEVDR